MYEVQHWTVFQGWINCWTDIDENDNDVPSVFETEEEARAALNDFYDEYKDAIKRGFIPDLPIDPDDYRIVKIETKGEKSHD